MIPRLKPPRKIAKPVFGPQKTVPALSRWFGSPAGRALLAHERRDIDRALSCLFGYHLCQISVCNNLNLAEASRISHTFALNPVAGGSSVTAGSCDFHRLPLAPESVDVFLLHHALDYSQTPHQLLAEATRATIPRGYLVIVGFNPWSLAGAWRGLKRLGGDNPLWRQQTLRLGRLLDWFALLDLEVVDIARGQYWPGGGTSPDSVFERAMRRVRAPWGNYYSVVVRKDVPGVTPVKPDWRSAKLESLKPVVPGKLTG